MIQGMASYGRYVMAGFLTIFGSVGVVRAQLVSDSVRVGPHYRSYHYTKPSGTDRPRSLVFVLHGSGGDGRSMQRAVRTLEPAARRQQTLVVYPDAYKRFWNECRKASPAAANQEDVDEQGFFSGMIAALQKQYGIDPKQVFVVGTSGGGHMAYKLGLTMPGTFRAITAIIANLPDSTNLDCVPSGRALPVMIVNGTEDPINPYEGGAVVLGGNMNMGRVRSTGQTLAYWAGLAHHTGQPTLEKLPDTNPGDGRTVERYTYHAAGKPDVVLLKVIGGKHDYPGDIDVHLEALRFFGQQIR